MHLTAPLDDVLGWTVDYGEVKARFEPIYRELDHQRLDERAGLEDLEPVWTLFRETDHNPREDLC